MAGEVVYTSRERLSLWILATFGVLVANGAFIYGVLFQPDAMSDAMANPIAAAFIVEALVLTVALAFLLRKWGLTGLSPVWFVVLSLLGSLAFALPVALLWRRRTLQ